MNLPLKPQQKEALDRYDQFRKNYPQAFSGRKHRPIVLDRSRLENYSVEHDVTLGVAALTDYFYSIVDLVESRDPHGAAYLHPYLRVVYRKQLEGATNVVVLATIAEPSLGCVGDMVLVEQERHATGEIELELPRGFGEQGLSGEENALQELQEETGFVGSNARLLGSTLTDSGLTDARVSFYHIEVTEQKTREPEIREAITGVTTMPRDQVRAKIADGRIRDGFTLQAMALFENQETSASRSNKKA